jgi:hypothetical protein
MVLSHFGCKRASLHDGERNCQVGALDAYAKAEIQVAFHIDLPLDPRLRGDDAEERWKFRTIGIAKCLTMVTVG